MKKLLALLLSLVMVLSMAACGGKVGDDSGNKTPAKNLQIAEMEIEASGLEDLTKATFGVPKNMEVEEKDWCYVITDEKQNVEIEAYICCDYDCYDYNQEASKEECEGYGEQKFGDFDGYYYIDGSGYYVEVYVYLGCVAEMDDVYLSFTIGALEGSSDNPMELFKLKDVQTLLCSAEFFPAQETEATN